MRAAVVFAMLLLSCEALAKSPAVRTGTNTTRDTAQPVQSTGQWGEGESETAPTEKALEVGRDMAKCVVKRRAEKVHVVLQAQNQEDFRRKIGEMQTLLSGCMIGSTDADVVGAQFQFGSATLAGLLAEALLLREGVRPVAPQKYDQNKPKYDWLSSGVAALVQLRVAECLADSQPAYVAPLVGSAPGATDEANAFRALAPMIQSCLDKNVTFAARRTPLRLALSFAMYRRMVQQAGAGGK